MSVAITSVFKHFNFIVSTPLSPAIGPWTVGSPWHFYPLRGNWAGARRSSASDSLNSIMLSSSAGVSGRFLQTFQAFFFWPNLGELEESPLPIVLKVGVRPPVSLLSMTSDSVTLIQLRASITTYCCSSWTSLGSYDAKQSMRFIPYPSNEEKMISLPC
jgi:hypothetical protein